MKSSATQLLNYIFTSFAIKSWNFETNEQHSVCPLMQRLMTLTIARMTSRFEHLCALDSNIVSEEVKECEKKSFASR